jgi:hypothetical protein
MECLKSGELVIHTNDRDEELYSYRVVPASQKDQEFDCDVIGVVIEHEVTFAHRRGEKPWLEYFVLTEGGYYVKKQ